MNYKAIIVDNFKDHIIESNKDIISTKRKRMNHGMINKNMYRFMCVLKYMSIKYSVRYYEALPNTTNKCCYCGNVNKYMLDINDRTFKCESCGKTIDRDVNASINCYNQYKLLKNF